MLAQRVRAAAWEGRGGEEGGKGGDVRGVDVTFSLSSARRRLTLICGAAEIIMMDGLVCVYRTVRDVLMYVVGTEHVNEVMLADMLNSLYQGFSALLKKQIEKRYILECLDLILLTLDEVFDDGIILESNPDAIVDLVGVRSESDVPLSEQTITQAFLKVRNKMDKFMK